MTTNSRSLIDEDGDKVEETLREFIQKIIQQYEKNNISNSILNDYEKEISNCETLLEVFEIIKDMFDNLMLYMNKNNDDIDEFSVQE